MPFSIEIDEADRLLIVRGSQAGTLPEALGAADSVLALLRERRAYGVFVDTLSLDYEPPVVDVLRIAAALFREPALVGGGVALVTRTGVQARLAQIFCGFGRRSGIDVQPFLNRDTALHWLCGRDLAGAWRRQLLRRRPLLPPGGLRGNTC